MAKKEQIRLCPTCRTEVHGNSKKIFCSDKCKDRYRVVRRALHKEALKHGKRVNLWIPGKQLETAMQIENISKFFQIALDNAADIMAWAILKEYEPKKYDTGRKTEDVIDEFNKKYPVNPLTAKRLHKNGTRTSSPDEGTYQESNPVLL
jgi:hypothetical protein